MGTNYYAIVDGKRIHLGKSAPRSAPLFQATPGLIANLEEWKAVVARASQIEAEYGSRLTPDEVFAEMMEGFGKGEWAFEGMSGLYWDRNGGRLYAFTATEFF